MVFGVLEIGLFKGGFLGFGWIWCLGLLSLVRVGGLVNLGILEFDFGCVC